MATIRKIKVTKLITTHDKRFFPEVGKVYKAVSWHAGRPIIMDESGDEVWLHQGEFEEVFE